MTIVRARAERRQHEPHDSAYPPLALQYALAAGSTNYVADVREHGVVGEQHGGRRPGASLSKHAVLCAFRLSGDS